LYKKRQKLLYRLIFFHKSSKPLEIVNHILTTFSHKKMHGPEGLLLPLSDKNIHCFLGHHKQKKRTGSLT
jgi:hypothetical protein